MKQLFAILMFFVSASAFAHNCPNEMKAIDAKLSTPTGLSAENLAKVKALRAEGEVQHKDGKHAESMASLGAAKKILGI